MRDCGKVIREGESPRPALVGPFDDGQQQREKWREGAESRDEVRRCTRVLTSLP